MFERIHLPARCAMTLPMLSQSGSPARARPPKISVRPLYLFQKLCLSMSVINLCRSWMNLVYALGICRPPRSFSSRCTANVEAPLAALRESRPMLEVSGDERGRERYMLDPLRRLYVDGVVLCSSTSFGLVHVLPSATFGCSAAACPWNLTGRSRVINVWIRLYWHISTPIRYGRGNALNGIRRERRKFREIVNDAHQVACKGARAKTPSRRSSA